MQEFFKIPILFLTVFILSISGYAQFEGGNDNGFANVRLGDTCHFAAYTPFAGGISDGFANARLGDSCSFTAFTPFAGGIADGFANARIGDTCQFIAFTPFAGGISDGFANARLGDTCQFIAFTPFAGGISDGFANARLGDTCSFTTFSPFLGGISDGFAFDTLIFVDAMTCELTTPLPIELLSFNALVSGSDKVRAFWTTMSERDNDYFTVERSIDGLSWIDLGKVPGAGNSTSKLDYEWFDFEPVNGISYYRLRQNDFDGKFTHSEVRSVVFNQTEHLDFLLYPNPTDGKINLSVIGKSLNNVQIKITSISGQIVYFEDGVSGNLLTHDLTNYSKGLYLLKVKTEEESYVFRVVKY